ncbi:MAG: ATP-binding protein [Gemmatimonadota bacterium]
MLWPLLSVVSVVMLAAGAYSAHRREQQLIADARRETNAYATALAVALEYALVEGGSNDLPRIIGRIAAEPRIYGVVVYDHQGKPISAALPLTEADALGPMQVQQFLSDTVPSSLDRELQGEQFHSVIRPLRGVDRRVVGGLEVVQPLGPIFAEVGNTRLRFLMATVILLAGVAGVVVLLVARVIAQPLHQLVAGARAFGRGQLTYRIEETGAAELAELSTEFNRMAENLETARSRLLRETEERVQLERRLRSAEKLAALGSLSAGLAHEIAAPLNVVAGRAEMLRRGSKPLEAHDRDLRIIIDQIGRITVIVRNLLDFARRREPHFQSVEVATLVGGAVELLDGELDRAGIQLDLECEADLVVRGDPQLLHQVLVNLLMNAIQSLEAVERNGRITVRAFRDRDMIAVEVEDNGIGVSDQNLSSLFEPFFTTKPPGSGTGLGLAVVKSIVEEHSGMVNAMHGNGPDGRTGALFRVRLPEALGSDG